MAAFVALAPTAVALELGLLPAIPQDLRLSRRPHFAGKAVDARAARPAIQRKSDRSSEGSKLSRSGTGEHEEAASSASRGALAVLAVSVVCSGRAALRRVRTRRDRGWKALRPASAPTLTATAPTVPSVPQTVKPSELFEEFSQRSKAAAKVLAGLPDVLPMPLLSVYTALPALSVLAALLCPSSTRLARGLAAALGCLVGTMAGAFLKQAKKDAASCSIARLLADHMQEAMSVAELRELIHGRRRRFGVPAGAHICEDWESTDLQQIYEVLLNKLVEGPEHDPFDLPALQRLKAALDLDGIVVGNAHRHAAQLLVSRGYSGLEGEPMRVATDKLLFLSERAFADEEPEEAGRYEMGRLCKVLQISEKEAAERIGAVSRALYQQNLTAVVDKVDAHTGEALAGAKAAFGLAGDEAERMNVDTYRQIAADQLSSGRLAPDGKTTLERARGVLQLGERAATAAFIAVATPILRKDVDEVTSSLQNQASSSSAESLKTFSEKLASRGEELGLSHHATFCCVREGMLDTLRSQYSGACKDARINGPEKALVSLDKLIAFAKAADVVLDKLKASDATADEGLPLTLTADPLSGRRLYSLYLERSFSGEAPNASSPDELARILELSEADEETARVETCQPRLRELYEATIEKAEASGTPLAQLKPDVSEQMAKFRMPFEAVEETAIEVYKARLAKLEGRIIKASEQEALQAARGFLELDRSSVRRLHLKAFAGTYEQSVNEAMGRSGIMPPEASEALAQLGERLGLESEDAEKIFHGVVEDRLRDLMVPVRDAWEEATYTKEALIQLNKERGKDLGDDPYSDGTGGDLGIKDSPPLEGVRGFKLMEELTKVADFYTRNKVFREGADEKSDDEDAWATAYPVQVGKWIEDKNKEEMFGIYAWNAVTCQDTASREKWTNSKETVGGVLGLSPKMQKKVLVRMVSRWCNMFIKNKIQEQGELSKDDISTLTDWVPMFFGIEKDVTKDMVQATNKGIIQSKVLALLNKPSVTPEDLVELRKEVDAWELEISKDLELSRPQLRSLFRVEVASVLEDPDLNDEQKVDGVEASREAFGLAEKEAMDEMRDLIKARCQACLVNALGDLMQEKQAAAVAQMQRLELLAAFGESAGIQFQQDWDVSPAMRQKLIKTYVAGAEGKKAPDVRLLERVLDLVTA
eukprot:gb/GFBE01002599.1/.p1 GENE.gb/GFBE01002599.1/~~gb/GFBE01002599.1/.p1  ORF type:complete len:1165 (+),score=322.87 gb/GFBE01002599.1/:1-3495(+)